MDRPRQDGTWLFLFHIYIGPVYQGCIKAKNKLQAVSQWSKMKQVGQVILRAELAENVEPEKVPSKRMLKAERRDHG